MVDWNISGVSSVMVVFALNAIIQLNTVSSTGEACWFIHILAPLGLRLFDWENVYFHLQYSTTIPAVHCHFYPSSKRKASLTACSPLHHPHCSTGCYRFEHCRAQLYLPWQEHKYTDRLLTVLFVIWSSLITWRSDWIIKLYETNTLSWDCSCIMQQNALDIYDFIQ